MAKIALLIGVSEYEPGLSALPGAIQDVEAMRQVLIRSDIGEFLDSDLTMLKNPHRQKMEEEVEKLFLNRQKDDLALLFFSGHGIKDDTGKLYLATSQTRKTPQGELIRSSAVAASFIHENMERSRCKRQVVILDSCFSGAFADGLSAKDDGTINIREQLGGEGRVVLTSSTSTQYSFEHQESNLSIYTKYLIDGMNTGAADLNDDGIVSIGELHEYASQKVRETYPAMKPEIYPGREGYTIRLTKVPLGDPKEKYRKEVSRYISHGDVTFVGRKILEALKNRLELSEAEAKTIEDETLAEVRQDFREKLQRYENDFTEAFQQDVPLNDIELDLLRQNLKQILGLRNEDIQPIEHRVRAKIEAYKQHLQQYERTFTEAIIKEYPLSERTRHELKQVQDKWELTAENVTSIESRLISEIEAYREKLQQYEQIFSRATQYEYPLSGEKRKELQQVQKNLALKAEDVALIEGRILAKVKAYKDKLQEYEQVFVDTIQHEYPITDESRDELKRLQRILELKDEDVVRIEARATRSKNGASLPTEESASLNTQTPESQDHISNKDEPNQILSEDLQKKTATSSEKLCQQQKTVSHDNLETINSKNKIKVNYSLIKKIIVLAVVLISVIFISKPNTDDLKLTEINNGEPEANNSLPYHDPRLNGQSKKDAVASVNGVYISKKTLENLEKEVAERSQGQTFPKEQLLEELIQRELLIQQALQKHLDEFPEVIERMATVTSKNSALSQAALQDYLKANPVTDEEIKAEYDSKMAKLGSEYKARHILVKTEDEAKKIIAKLENGADFADLAKKYSIDPMGSEGGDLGWFTADQMVTPFSEAVMALKNGEFIKQPVQTQFGWHVILREDSKALTPLPLKDIKEQILQMLQRQKIQAMIEKLRKSAKVEIFAN